MLISNSTRDQIKQSEQSAFPLKTLIVLFVAGFFSNLKVGLWSGLNLKQQLSEEEREHKTQTAERDMFPLLTRCLNRPESSCSNKTCTGYRCVC